MSLSTANLTKRDNIPMRLLRGCVNRQGVPYLYQGSAYQQTMSIDMHRRS